MVLLSFLVAAACVTTSLSAVLFPGPRTTTTDGGGHKYVESSIWDGEDATKHYGKVSPPQSGFAQLLRSGHSLTGLPISAVTDYGDLRPTVVYNCHWMIALCQNARAYLPGGGNGPWTFHYDRAEYRNKARRDSICPSDWADRNCINGPTLDWYTEQDNGVKRYPPMQYCVRTPKRHGYHKPGQVNADNTPRSSRPVSYQAVTSSLRRAGLREEFKAELVPKPSVSATSPSRPCSMKQAPPRSKTSS